VTMSGQEMSDRLEIQDLMLRYSYAIDFHDWDALDDVFSEDAEIDYTAFGGPVGDRASTKRFLAESLSASFLGYQHMVTGTAIEFRDDGTARARTQCHNPMAIGDADDPTVVIASLWYVDTLVKTPDGWRIRERMEQPVFLRRFETGALTGVTGIE
jgi:SnoaL-like domain